MTDQMCENNKSKNFFDKMFYFVAVFSKKNKLDYTESYKIILEKVTQRTSKENKYCENLLFLIQTIKTSPKRLMDITNEVKEFVVKWGIEVEAVTITDLGIVKSFRIFGDEAHKTTILPTDI
jgi:hypothetical protein